MTILLCVGGPADGQKRVVDGSLQHGVRIPVKPTCAVTPASDFDRVASVAEEVEIADYYLQVWTTSDGIRRHLLVPQFQTADETFHKLLANYRPEKPNGA